MATSGFLLTISSESRECISSLKTLRSSGPTNEVSRQSIDDALGRLKVWGTNLGAFQPPQSQKSLDHRLRDAPKMRTSVLSGLERLQLCSRKALGIISGSIPNRHSVALAVGLTGSTADDEPTTELDELLLGTHASIDHLFSLAILIRRHRPRGRNAPQSKLQDVDNSPDIINVGDKFPKAKEKPWLLSRLGNATTQRRQYIQYRQQHKQKLANQRDEQTALSTSGDAQTVVSGGSTNVTTLATTFEEGPTDLPELEFPQTANRMSVMTSATSFVSNFEDEGNMGRRVPELSSMVLDGVRLEYDEPFECPYCRTIQVVANRLEWKRHVFTDLQPYTCTFEDCESELFCTRQEWLQHERQVHRLRWSCHLCETRKAVFDSEEDLRIHFNKHPEHAITKTQLPLLLQASKSPINYFDSSACPLCNEWESSSGVTDNSKQFFRHLARHLQQIALEALPLAINGLEIVGSGSESEDEGSSDTETGTGTGTGTDTDNIQTALPKRKSGSAPKRYSTKELLERFTLPPQDPDLHLTRSGKVVMPSQLKIRVNQWDGSYLTLIVAYTISYKSLVDRIDAKLARTTDKTIGGGKLVLCYRDGDGDDFSITSGKDLSAAIHDLSDYFEYGATPEIELFTKLVDSRNMPTLATKSEEKAPPLPPLLPPSTSSTAPSLEEFAALTYVRVKCGWHAPRHAPYAKKCLSIRAGDLIEVMERNEDSWSYGVLNDVAGWFPDNYCY